MAEKKFRLLLLSLKNKFDCYSVEREVIENQDVSERCSDGLVEPIGRNFPKDLDLFRCNHFRVIRAEAEGRAEGKTEGFTYFFLQNTANM